MMRGQDNNLAAAVKLCVMIVLLLNLPSFSDFSSLLASSY